MLSAKRIDRTLYKAAKPGLDFDVNLCYSFGVTNELMVLSD